MNITTIENMPLAIRQSLEELALYAPYENMPALLFAYETDLPMHSGRTVEYMRVKQLPITGAAINPDGTEVAPQRIEREFVSATIQYYGITVVVNNQLANHDQYDIITQTAIRVGEARMRTENLLMMNTLNSCTNVYRCELGTNGDDPTEISVQDLRIVETSHKQSEVDTFFESIPSGRGENSYPVPESYVMIAPELIRPTLLGNTDFVQAYSYGSNYRIAEMETGALSQHRFMLTTSAGVQPKTSTSGKDVGVCVSFGRDTYARIRSSAATGDVRIRDPSTFSYHSMNTAIVSTFIQAQAILQDFGITRVLCRL